MLRLGIHGCLIACLAASSPALAAADDAGGDRLLRAEDPAGAGQGVLQVPLGRGQEAARAGCCSTRRAGVLAGGDSGPAVVPGKPEESLLIEALRHEGLAMPPKGKLPDAVIADFERWVEMGAPDPRDGQAAAGREAGIDLEAGRKFWSFQPPRRHAPPAVADAGWPRTDIDRFLLAAPRGRGAEAGRARPTGRR